MACISAFVCTHFQPEIFRVVWHEKMATPMLFTCVHEEEEDMYLRKSSQHLAGFAVMSGRPGRSNMQCFLWDFILKKHVFVTHVCSGAEMMANLNVLFLTQAGQISLYLVAWQNPAHIGTVLPCSCYLWLNIGLKLLAFSVFSLIFIQKLFHESVKWEDKFVTVLCERRTLCLSLKDAVRYLTTWCCLVHTNHPTMAIL